MSDTVDNCTARTGVLACQTVGFRCKSKLYHHTFSVPAKHRITHMIYLVGALTTALTHDGSKHSHSRKRLTFKLNLFSSRAPSTTTSLRAIL